MYAEKNPRLQKSGGEKSNHPLLITLTVTILILVAVGLYFFWKSSQESPTNQALAECEKILNSQKEGAVVVTLCIRKDGTLRLIWKDLPEETSEINIYKTTEEGGAVLWRSINVYSNSGFVDLGEDEEPPVSYILEGSSRSGEAVWQIQGTGELMSVESGPSDSQAVGENGAFREETPSPSSQTTPQEQTAPADTQTPAEQPEEEPPPVTNPLPPETEVFDSSTEVYYTPSGQVSATSSIITTANFWVRHVNQKIEIGWQGLPDNSDKISVYRSKTESGGYAILLEQLNPNTTGDFIRLDDHSIDEPYYYKMEAKEGSIILEVYGPEFLPALGG